MLGPVLIVPIVVVIAMGSIVSFVRSVRTGVLLRGATKRRKKAWHAGRR